jgi:signal transduction histidine kinase
MKNACFCAFACLLLSGAVHGQPLSTGDSILSLNIPDTSKLAMLNNWIKSNSPNLREPLIPISLATIELAKKTGNAGQISSAYNSYGTVLYFQEKISDAAKAFQKALEYAEKAADPLLIIPAYRGMMRTCLAQGDNVQSLQYLYKMELLMSQIKDPNLISTGLNNICNTYSTLKRWDDVERISRQAIAYNRQNHLIKQLPGALYHLGKTFEVKGKLDSAVFYLLLARKGFIEINNQEEYAGMTMQLAQIYAKQGKKGLAIAEMDLALKTVENNRDSAGIAFVSMEQGRLFMKLGRLPEAEFAFLRSKDLFERMKLPPYQKNIYVALSDFYTQKKEFELALNYFKKYISIKDTLEGAETQKKLLELEAEFENTKKEQEISLLHRINHTQSLQIGLLAAMAGVFLLAAMAIFLMIRNKQRKQLLKQQQLWVKTLAESTENERQRIAADLHDGIVQQLAALKLMATGISKKISDNAGTEMNQLIGQIEKTSLEVRHISHQMMPRSLGELGLAAAMEDLFWLSFSQTNIHFQVDTEHFSATPQAVRDTFIYRIAQEAVNNILKHAAATAVELKLYSDATAIHLTITDNGRGFDLNAPSSIGMKTMSSRAQLFNGQFEVKTEPQKGTKISVSIPF